MWAKRFRRRNGYLERLHALPTLRTCSWGHLAAIAALVDDVALPNGAALDRAALAGESLVVLMGSAAVTTPTARVVLLPGDVVDAGTGAGVLVALTAARLLVIGRRERATLCTRSRPS